MGCGQGEDEPKALQSRKERLGRSSVTETDCGKGVTAKLQDATLIGLTCWYGVGCALLDLLDKGPCRGADDPRADGRAKGAVQPADLKANLPAYWVKRLADGQMWTALILASSYSEKYKGKDMEPGACASVRLPVSEAVWQPKFLQRAGCRDAAVIIWLGDESVGDRTVYVAFSMLHHFGQAKEILWSTLERAEGIGSEDDSNLEASSWSRIMVNSYLRRVIERLWGEHKLKAYLTEIAAKYPNHRFSFSGVSHGAALAQAALLRIQLEEPGIDAEAVTWNAYKWTDAAGSELAGKVLGERLLPLALSRWVPGHCGQPGSRYWDSISACPEHMEHLPQLRLLDVDSGAVLSCSSQGENCPGRAKVGFPAFRRLWKLHFADLAIIATKKAMRSLSSELPRDSA
ncbi:unnamed protein product [Polarella glacialis]|uniref:Uncharacterized protein n=1 Tax=Polarella glacialis TaxID=89957 RepID=A0A813LB26_POLGL|nr:unnamed protein product [Polarella glacialis]